ncbi:uncharacterized protein LOC129921119 [Episyrphus balteatus]|uniref:uncharacterized protein LOC129921119 n=1 Tax=Episyrphus balteatus TaxID=286459 RepID=UPI0024854F2F|nr:uncharacterized protein LOC129921119 [Episyrphus balteatus]XP_055858781.1 uncharacterized protein LOC129921119 [Episyrphus balteatus]
MAIIPTIKRFSPSGLPRVTIFVGCLLLLHGVFRILFSVYEMKTRDQEDPVFVDAHFVDAMISISISIIFGFVGLLLIIGTYKKSHLMLLPWLILEGLGLVIYFLQTSMNIISLIVSEDNYNNKLQEFAISMVYLSIMGLCVYIWLAVLQFYQMLRDEKQKPIKDDEEKLVSKIIIKNPVRRDKPYLPAYVIPISYSKPQQPPSQIKY